MHLSPLPLVVFSDFVAQLRLGQPLGGALLFFLKLEQKFLALCDQLPRRIGVRPQLFGDRFEPCFVIGTHAGADVLRRRVGGRADARKPRLVLTPFLQQPLNGGRALR